MLTKEYLAERIAHYGEVVEAHVLAHDRALAKLEPISRIDYHLDVAAKSAAIFNALSTIAANK